MIPPPADSTELLERYALCKAAERVVLEQSKLPEAQRATPQENQAAARRLFSGIFGQARVDWLRAGSERPSLEQDLWHYVQRVEALLSRGSRT